MFAPSQQKCAVCGVRFVPFSRDMVTIWDGELEHEPDWLASRKWAKDRVYREMQLTCSADHAVIMEQQVRELQTQEAWERYSRKYR